MKRSECQTKFWECVPCLKYYRMHVGPSFEFQPRWILVCLAFIHVTRPYGICDPLHILGEIFLGLGQGLICQCSGVILGQIWMNCGSKILIIKKDVSKHGTKCQQISKFSYNKKNFHRLSWYFDHTTKTYIFEEILIIKRERPIGNNNSRDKLLKTQMTFRTS